MNTHFIPSKPEKRSRHLLMVDATLVGAMVFMPNLVMAIRLRERFSYNVSGWLERLGVMLATLTSEDAFLWLGINCSMLVVLFALRQHLVVPLGRIAHHVQVVRTAFADEMGRGSLSPLNVRMLARDMARFALLAQEYYQKYLGVSHELEQSRRLIAYLNSQQEAMLTTTNREIIAQYQSILAYANYLEEHIQRKHLDVTLRYDFDDVCEASFNLKLLAGALATLRHEQEPIAGPVRLAHLMQQTMLVLAPSLDRRSMKLTTAEVDTSVTALSDPALLSQIIWVILLGTIRYAASESTLRLRCLYSGDGAQALMSIVISELSPGKLTDAERGALPAAPAAAPHPAYVRRDHPHPRQPATGADDAHAPRGFDQHRAPHCLCLRNMRHITSICSSLILYVFWI